MANIAIITTKQARIIRAMWDALSEVLEDGSVVLSEQLRRDATDACEEANESRLDETLGDIIKQDEEEE